MISQGLMSMATPSHTPYKSRQITVIPLQDLIDNSSDQFKTPSSNFIINMLPSQNTNGNTQLSLMPVPGGFKVRTSDALIGCRHSTVVS